MSILLTQLAFISTASGQISRLSAEELLWLGDQIYQNECSQNFECLTSWNAGENFPSLGIGHFIWFRAGQREPFEETFPGLLDYLRDQGETLPPWLQDSAARDAPWASREQFVAELDGPRLTELRQFLYRTRSLQVAFIVARLETVLDAVVRQFPPAQQAEIRRAIEALAAAHPPLGHYALIDYLHFKGSGLNPAERYRGQGWGLVQVLAQLQRPVSLQGFVDAAGAVLERRVRNAPPERDEQRWLAGWKARLNSYLPKDITVTN